jgi:hypothetical protein
VAVTRASTAAASASSRRPLLTWRASDLASPATIASAVSCLRERRTTVVPALAATSAMPDPMIPDPTMPMLSMAIA